MPRQTKFALLERQFPSCISCALRWPNQFTHGLPSATRWGRAATTVTRPGAEERRAGTCRAADAAVRRPGTPDRSKSCERPPRQSETPQWRPASRPRGTPSTCSNRAAAVIEAVLLEQSEERRAVSVFDQWLSGCLFDQRDEVYAHSAGTVVAKQGAPTRTLHLR